MIDSEYRDPFRRRMLCPEASEMGSSRDRENAILGSYKLLKIRW
jgi:hypothetical protein